MNFICKLHNKFQYINFFKINFNTSSVSKRHRPPHHKSLFRSKTMPFNTVYYDNDSAGPYKVIMDKENNFPPGKWGSMSIKSAWERYEESIRLQNLPTNLDKMLSMFWTEYNMWYHTVTMPLEIPEKLEFCQFITRTKINYSVPDTVTNSFSNISNTNIKSACNLIRLQINNYLLQNKKYVFNHDIDTQNKYSTRFINLIMDSIIRTKQDHEFLENYTTSPQSLIETYIKRSGYDELKVPEHVKDAEGCIHYRFRGKLAWSLRSRNPLKEFVQINDPNLINDGNQFPQYNYHPKTFDLEPVDCHDFTNLPFIFDIENSEHVRNIPGFWGSSHVKFGDPCGFSVLGVVNINLSRKIINNFIHEHPEIVDRHCCSEALLAGFIWTMAQAQNQGFSIYDELTYPFCSSLLLTNGQSIQMIYYQLNSISSLWKPEDAGFPVNMMWISPKINLFEFGTNNQIQDINEHAVHQILASLSMPVLEISSSQLQPYLKEVAARDIEHFVKDFDFSSATEKEKVEYKEGIKVRQIKRIRRAHPNRLFYFEKKSTIMMKDELRKIVPDVDSMPKLISNNVAGYNLIRQMRKGKKKLLKYPPEWR